MLVLAIELPCVAHETVLELLQVLDLQRGLRVSQSGAIRCEGWMLWFREIQQICLQLRVKPTLALLEADVLFHRCLVRLVAESLPRTDLHLVLDCMRVIEADKVRLAVSRCGCHRGNLPLEGTTVEVSTLTPSTASERSGLLAADRATP